MNLVLGHNEVSIFIALYESETKFMEADESMSEHALNQLELALLRFLSGIFWNWTVFFSHEEIDSCDKFDIFALHDLNLLWRISYTRIDKKMRKKTTQICIKKTMRKNRIETQKNKHTIS